MYMHATVFIEQSLPRYCSHTGGRCKSSLRKISLGTGFVSRLYWERVSFLIPWLHRAASKIVRRRAFSYLRQKSKGFERHFAQFRLVIYERCPKKKLPEISPSRLDSVIRSFKIFLPASVFRPDPCLQIDSAWGQFLFPTPSYNFKHMAPIRVARYSWNTEQKFERPKHSISQISQLDEWRHQTPRFSLLQLHSCSLFQWQSKYIPALLLYLETPPVPVILNLREEKEHNSFLLTEDFF